MTEFTTTARGDRVAYDLYGSGPAIIFVAGAGPYRAVDPSTTETAQQAAGHGVTALVFDRLGRGESDAEGALTLERELDAIAALLDVVGGSAVLCGHSSGCSISLRAAADGLPVEGLALWEAPLAGDAADTQAWSDHIEKLIDAGRLEGAKEHYMKDMPPEWLAGAKASPEWPEIAAGVVSTRADAQSMAWAIRGLERANLGDIRVPVLAMYGTETFGEMTTAAERIVRTLPDAVMKEMPGAQHSWEPEPMAAELAAFAKVSIAAR
ncbi:alpha/beta fold hydrolase [Arthrobacter castelli]|uniref:alpha/beta fold hydrolase n=1 Tax=Arthrobacter castelli TaxID=271431 RepID=UPI000405E747|nr:alpha/beta hydrolase [Arthrobacter castelli]